MVHPLRKRFLWAELGVCVILLQLSPAAPLKPDAEGCTGLRWLLSSAAGCSEESKKAPSQKDIDRTMYSYFCLIRQFDLHPLLQQSISSFLYQLVPHIHFE